MPRPSSTGCKVRITNNVYTLYQCMVIQVAFPSPQRSRCGSFLRHNQATLRRLSTITSNTPSLSAPGKGFVFQRNEMTTPITNKSNHVSPLYPHSLIPSLHTHTHTHHPSDVLTRSMGCPLIPQAHKPQAKSVGPHPKKPRLDKSISLPTGSIFTILK